MVGLVDIATASEKVPIGEQKIEVYGVSARGVAMLLGRFPDLRALMSGVQVDPAKLMALGGDVVAAIIAAGVGQPGDSDAEAKADRLPLDAQVDILAAILRLTMPSGIGPFAEKLAALTSVLGEGGAALRTVPVTKSRKP